MTGVDHSNLTALADELVERRYSAIAVDKDPLEHESFLASVALGIAEQRKHEVLPVSLLEHWNRSDALSIPPEAGHPEFLGVLYERLIGRENRKRRGSFYTPGEVASTVAGWALVPEASDGDRIPVVCDPAAGGGAFLLAAGNALVDRGHSREAVVEHSLIGADIDPLAASVCEASLMLWAEGLAAPRILVTDSLATSRDEFPCVPDVVIGNPPFLSQLSAATARTREQARLVEGVVGEELGGYTDAASLFWLMGCRLVGPEGRVAMILPRSTLAVRDAEAIRNAVLREMDLEILWVPGHKLFEASVDVCVMVTRKRRTSADQSPKMSIYADMPPVLQHKVNMDMESLRASKTWSPLLAEAMGVPDVSGSTHISRIGDICEVVADFRDEYYGLIPFVVDDPEDLLDDDQFPRLITVGLIDPARCKWGEVQTRFARTAWQAPRIDLEALQRKSRLARWAQSRLVPKVVIATQTTILEAAVDEAGSCLPVTPVVSAIAGPDDLWRIAAALLSPFASAWALRNAAGAAFLRGGIKLSAGQVREIPLPGDRVEWDQATALVREASNHDDLTKKREMLIAAGEASTRAYGVGKDVAAWWTSRFPGSRGGSVQVPAR